ncbi:MAG: hypothetical protein SFY32_14990 [Bacteroidota bacterium]|nr:hypothetical protein [Bacteroidota bacterium]
MNEKISFLESSQTILVKLLAALKELASKDEKVRDALLHNNLM